MKNIDEYEAKQILRKYKVPLVEENLVSTVHQAEEVAKRIGFPVIMKINSPEIHHKTDIGGVFEARNLSDIHEYFSLIMKNAKKVTNKINGVLIEKKIEGIELIIGVNKDPQFGHVIMFGLGGIYVELLKDVNFRAIPVSKKDAFDLIEEMNAKKILEGFRHFRPVKKERIVEILLKVSKMIEENEEICELDINPLIVSGNEAIVVDALMKVE